MNWVDAVSVILGALLVVGSVLSTLRFVLLLNAAKKDRDIMDGYPSYVTSTYEFFVKAAYVHVFKSGLIFVAGSLVVLSRLPEVSLSIRLISTPVVLLGILGLLLTLGEIENRTRQAATRSYIEEQRKE